MTVENVRITSQPVGAMFDYLLTAAGEMRYIDFRIGPVFDENGEVIYLVPEGYDITKRKQAEEQILASLKEKEALLGEIHHRVKNNLTIIASLFSMSSRRTNNQELIGLLQEAKAKIHTMALIHSQLTAAGNWRSKMNALPG